MVERPGHRPARRRGKIPGRHGERRARRFVGPTGQVDGPRHQRPRSVVNCDDDPWTRAIVKVTAGVRMNDLRAVAKRRALGPAIEVARAPTHARGGRGGRRCGAVLITFFGANAAMANAPNPVGTPPITGNIVTNSNGTVTVNVTGTWVWPFSTSPQGRRRPPRHRQPPVRPPLRRRMGDRVERPQRHRVPPRRITEFNSQRQRRRRVPGREPGQSGTGRGVGLHATRAAPSSRPTTPVAGAGYVTRPLDGQRTSTPTPHRCRPRSAS